MTPGPVRVRAARADDGPFLAAVVALAVAWRPDATPSTAGEVLADPVLAHYIDEWPRSGDLGFVAIDEAGDPIGAAWWRYLPAEDPGYGFVAADVPEITIGVAPDRRGHGVGSALLSTLLAAADEHGLSRVSLSVEPDNPARRLYERLGFVVTVADPPNPRAGDSLTLVRTRQRPSG